MPTYVTGDLWDELDKADLLLVTTNSTRSTQGELVMGRGAALEARQRFPWLPRMAAEAITQAGVTYGVIRLQASVVTKTLLGLFQVKYHWRSDASQPLIAFSACMLCGLSDQYGRIAFNFPGIGHGLLAAESVIPWLAPLPAHVYIYSRAGETHAS
jgi:hypothetical protein